MRGWMRSAAAVWAPSSTGKTSLTKHVRGKRNEGFEACGQCPPYDSKGFVVPTS